MTNERTEALMRIPIGIVSGIILVVWRYLIAIFVVLNFFYTLFSGRRMKELAEMSEVWNTYQYVFIRYLIFVSNERPFPFNKLAKKMSKFSKN